jgi:hypothetical protein
MNLSVASLIAALPLAETTLVVAVLLGLISVIFIDASAYKEISKRSKGILNLSDGQKSQSSSQNLHVPHHGDALAMAGERWQARKTKTIPSPSAVKRNRSADRGLALPGLHAGKNSRPGPSRTGADNNKTTA